MSADVSQSLRNDVSDFYHHEANLLDERRWEDWLELFTDDVTYQIPLRFNVPAGSEDRESSVLGRDICWVDDTKSTLEMRVEQIRTGVHWAEEPVSRTTRVVSNVLIEQADGPMCTVSSRVIVHRSRVATDTDLMFGRRRDVLVRVDDQLRVNKRVVYIDQNVLLQKNLTVPI